MNDQYEEALALDAQQREQYWEAIESESEHSIVQLFEEVQLGEF
jgi:hypothetical protein